MSASAEQHPLMEAAPARARAAIRAGDTEAALQAVDDMLAEALPIHDMMGDLAASLLTFIGEKLGDEGVEQAWRHAAEDCWRPFFEACKAANDVEGFAQGFIAFLHSHRYDFTVSEDDDRWVVEVHYGTSGERMLVEGKVRGAGGDPDGHHRFGATKDAHPWTFGFANFPYYDVHSAVWMSLQPREWGWPVLDCEYGEKHHGEVAEQRFIIYKDPARRAQELAAANG
jgi:hypothetical protein